MTPSTSALVALCGLINRLFGSVASSIAVLDEDAAELRYVASSGPGADVVMGMRLPLTAGIAGFVASTGQAMAVGDTGRDPRFAEEVAQRTGHVPATLLVVPIIHAEEVIGVVSVLDRSGATDDLERAGDVAEIAAELLVPPAGSAVVSATALESLDPGRRATTIQALSAVLTLAGLDPL